ncbi:MAG: hypothetical protein LBM95_08695 [Lactobacillales bacterium]|jgi:hypothetical protein|nr:hypothetical protein [Lactobacillales bacterium]
MVKEKSNHRKSVRELREEKEEKRKQLLALAKEKEKKRLAQQTIETSGKVVKETKNSFDLKTIQKFQKEVARLRKENRKKDHELKVREKRLSELKIEKRKQEKTLKSLQEKLEQTEKNVAKTEKEATIKLQAYHKFLKQVDISEKEFLTEAGKFEEWIQLRDSEKNFHKMEYQRLRASEKKHYQQLSQEKNIEMRWNFKQQKYRNKIDRLSMAIRQKNTEIQQLYKKNQALKRQLQGSLKHSIEGVTVQHFPVRELIGNLRERLNQENFFEFDDLNRLVMEYDRRLRELAEVYGDFRYGYATLSDTEDWLFHDIYLDELFPMTLRNAKGPAKQLAEGDAVKVRFNELEKTAELVYVLTSIGSYRYGKAAQNKWQYQKIKQEKQRKRTSQSGKLLAEAFFTGENAKIAKQLEVLVVNAKHGERYLEALQPLVKKVVLMDPYERNEKQIFTAMNSYDIVFVGTEGVPHSITDYISQKKKDDIRVQLMYCPSRSDILARVNWLILSGGVSSFENQ